MCFYCILYGIVCISEGIKLGEKVILSGPVLGYVRWLVFSEKRNRLTCWFFRISVFRTMDVLLRLTNCESKLSPLSVLLSLKYDTFCSLFNIGKNHGCDTKN